jgi:Bifunctional DNA primase/polymerase, N-terminal.
VGPDKAPRTPRGFYDATTSLKQIRAWDWDGAMIGHPPESGVVIIDVDPRNGGEMTMGLFPALPRTRTTKTRSDGRHYWLTVDPSLEMRGKLGPGVDVKRAGKGYVVIPPSPGYKYLVDGRMAKAPRWLVEELTATRAIPEGAAVKPRYFSFQTGTPYGEAALRNALKELRDVGQGGRSVTLNKVAFSLAMLSAGGELHPDKTCEALLEVALEIGLDEPKAIDVLRSGWFAGERHPRSAPR